MIRFLMAVSGLVLVPAVQAQLLTGFIRNYADSYPPVTFGDGVHSVSLSWSVNHPDHSGWFYRVGQTEVALALGVTSVEQITDAGSYSFTTPASYYIGPVFDVGYTGGPDLFIVLKNTQDDYFGVVRTDDVFRYDTPIDHGTWASYSGLNATWWFQPNGTGDFSPVPEPSVLALLGLGALALVIWRRRR